MKKSILFGQLISLVAQLLQYKRQKNVFKFMSDNQERLYLLGGVISTVAVILSYLDGEEDDEEDE